MAIPTRILFICHDGDLYGSQQSLNLIIRHLPPDAYQCFVSMARPGPLEKLLDSYPNTVVLRHRRLQWVKHDFRTKLQKFGDVLTLLLCAFPRTWYLVNTIRREKINVVHTNSTVSLEGALAAAIAGVPHIWHIRELFMERSPKFHMVLGCRFSRWLIDQFSDAVICISNAVRQQFRIYLDEEPDKYYLIYNALELGDVPYLLSRHDPQMQAKRSLSLKVLDLPETGVFRIGYIGRLSAGKGFHELLEALFILKHRGIYVEVLVAGNFVDNAYRERITAMIQGEDWQHAVHFLGYRDDLTPLYDSIDILVVPSVNEPFGRVVIESMIKGVPCLAANAGGIPEIIDPGMTGFLYPPGYPEALADELASLMETPWKLDAVRENARRMVCERFNIETQVRMLDQCYQSVLQHHQLF
jgi:glycosyltransferase involved in cell wall biosynthesis